MAAAPPPQIDVYAPLPLDIALDPALNLDPTNWHWVHCLALPLGKLSSMQVSQRPYKWIRYAIGVVVGAEGVLSNCRDSIDVVDYDAALPAESATLYYHLSNDERQRMFPADPNTGHTQVTSSIHTTRRATFHDDVARRDGRVCVLTGYVEDACDAVHLLPHSKGDVYISTYTQRRSRDPTGGDIIQDIDSVRNGLLLNSLSHKKFGTNIAFLMTPNFAMNTADIDPTAPPAERRFTTHLFKPDEPCWLGNEHLPLGSPAHIPDTPASPPAILFDAVYASAVIHHFGTQTLKAEVSATWKDAFYGPGGVMTASQADYKAITDERAADEELKQKHDRERGTRYAVRYVPDTYDILIGLPYMCIPPEKLQHVLREAEEKGKAAEQSHVQEKVGSWLRQVTAA